MGDMIARPLSLPRLPLVAIAALALLAFVALSANRLSFTPASIAVSAPSSVVVQAPALRSFSVSTSDGCADNRAYVTGDMVGEASPAAVYANLCH